MKRKTNQRRRNGNKKVVPMGNQYRNNGVTSTASMRSLTSNFRGGFPDRARVKLVYTDLINISSVTVVPAVQIYRGNSVFDPDYTGTGLQPAYYDDWSLPYNEYRVWGSKITISMAAASATTQGRFVVAARRTATGPATVTALLGECAEAYTRSGLVGPNGFSGIDNSRQGLGTSVSLSVSTCQFKACTPEGFIGQEDLSSLVTTNPADPWFWHVAVINVDGSSSATYRGTVTIEYDVEFFIRFENGLDLKMKKLRDLYAANELRKLKHLSKPQCDSTPAQDLQSLERKSAETKGWFS